MTQVETCACLMEYPRRNIEGTRMLRTSDCKHARTRNHKVVVRCKVPALRHDREREFDLDLHKACKKLPGLLAIFLRIVPFHDDDAGDTMRQGRQDNSGRYSQTMCANGSDIGAKWRSTSG